MNTMETSVEKVPTYLMGYLINGDTTGLTEQEINDVDDLLRKQVWNSSVLPPPMRIGSLTSPHALGWGCRPR